MKLIYVQALTKILIIHTELNMKQLLEIFNATLKSEEVLEIQPESPLDLIFILSQNLIFHIFLIWFFLAWLL